MGGAVVGAVMESEPRCRGSDTQLDGEAVEECEDEGLSCFQSFILGCVGRCPFTDRKRFLESVLAVFGLGICRFLQWKVAAWYVCACDLDGMIVVDGAIVAGLLGSSGLRLTMAKHAHDRYCVLMANGAIALDVDAGASNDRSECQVCRSRRIPTVVNPQKERNIPHPRRAGDIRLTVNGAKN